MKRILILLIFFGFFLTSNNNSAFAAASNTTDNKCVTCAPLSGWTGFEGIPNRGAPPLDLGGLGGSFRYVCPDGSVHSGAAPSCIQDNISSHYCQYHSETGKSIGSELVKDVYAIPSSVQINNACSGNKPECSTKQGCIASDESENEQKVCKANQSCRSQSDCKGTDPQCSSNWCVSPEDKLLSDLDGDRREIFKCKFFTPGTTPECPEGANCNNPFNDESNASWECSDNKDCFSGQCDLTNHTCIGGRTALACIEKPPGTGKFVCQTAVGNISTDPNSFGKSILALLMALAGGILLVLIIINGYKMMISQGDPEKIKDAREGIIAAITGILLIIFSLAILRLITADILGIPGFG